MKYKVVNERCLPDLRKLAEDMEQCRKPATVSELQEFVLRCRGLSEQLPVGRCDVVLAVLQDQVQKKVDEVVRSSADLSGYSAESCKDTLDLMAVSAKLFGDKLEDFRLAELALAKEVAAKPPSDKLQDFAGACSSYLHDMSDASNGQKIIDLVADGRRLLSGVKRHDGANVIGQLFNDLLQKVFGGSIVASEAMAINTMVVEVLAECNPEVAYDLDNLGGIKGLVVLAADAMETAKLVKGARDIGEDDAMRAQKINDSDLKVDVRMLVRLSRASGSHRPLRHRGPP